MKGLKGTINVITIGTHEPYRYLCCQQRKVTSLHLNDDVILPRINLLNDNACLPTAGLKAYETSHVPVNEHFVSAVMACSKVDSILGFMSIFRKLRR